MQAAQKLPDWPPEVPAAPPGEDELPYDFGPPMESNHHRDNMNLLVDTLRAHWKDRPRGAVEGNMAFYFSELQVYKNDFLGPDVFVVSDGVKRNRKSWVMWQEGLLPDVVIELLSTRTEHRDRGEKKDIYAHVLRVTDYFLFDPQDARFEGYVLNASQYEPVTPDPDGRMPVSSIGLKLGVVWSVDHGERLPWLRWFTAEGDMLPTDGEIAALEAQRAEAEAQRAEAEAQRAEAEAQRAEAEAQRADSERARADRASAEVEALRAKLRALGLDPDA